MTLRIRKRVSPSISYEIYCKRDYIKTYFTLEEALTAIDELKAGRPAPTPAPNPHPPVTSITVNNITHTVTEWAGILGISRQMLYYRAKRAGLSVPQYITASQTQPTQP